MQEAANWIMLYLVVPVWVAVGFADGLCHQATNIATTSGLKENLLHWLMYVEIGIAVAAGLLLETDAAVLVLVFVVFLVHEASVYLDLDYSTLRRDVGPFEQMVHSFQELLPLMWLLLLALMAWPQALAVFRQGGDVADWSLRLKAAPLPMSYLVIAGALTGVFNVLLLAFETATCVAARTRSARTPASDARVEPRFEEPSSRTPANPGPR